MVVKDIFIGFFFQKKLLPILGQLRRLHHQRWVERLLGQDRTCKVTSLAKSLIFRDSIYSLLQKKVIVSDIITKAL